MLRHKQEIMAMLLLGAGYEGPIPGRSARSRYAEFGSYLETVKT